MTGVWDFHSEQEVILSNTATGLAGTVDETHENGTVVWIFMTQVGRKLVHLDDGLDISVQSP